MIVRFGVLMTATINITLIFWDVIPDIRLHDVTSYMTLTYPVSLPINHLISIS
jgi:hypothetical protein